MFSYFECLIFKKAVFDIVKNHRSDTVNVKRYLKGQRGMIFESLCVGDMETAKVAKGGGNLQKELSRKKEMKSNLNSYKFC